VDVCSQFYDDIPESLVIDLYSQLKWCVNQDNEQLAKSGTNCLENFVIGCGQRFTPDIWQRTCTCILEVFRSTIPEMLLTWRPDAEQSGMAIINETVMLDRTDSSFDYAAVESASSQQHRLARVSSIASVNSNLLDHQEPNLNHRRSSSSLSERTSITLNKKQVH
ncbi:unnamed protein product, partial [Adineta steineri]